MIRYDSLYSTALPSVENCIALGLFDGLHLGHRAVISAAVETAKAANMQPYVFTFSIERSRPAGKPASGRLLTSTLRDRYLRELGVTRLLCPPFSEFRNLSPELFVRDILHERLHARHIFCGENFHFGKNAAGTPDDLRAFGRSLGIELHTLPMVDVDGIPVSSSRIRACIADGDMPEARKMLGRPFTIDFSVIHGRSLGRTIGSPTINQPMDEYFVRPRFGVYASVATVAGRRYAAVSNIGVKPTIGSDQVLCETCILGFEGDLYGKRIPVELYEFIRPETKFDSIDALRAQIRRDTATSEAIVGRIGI